MSMKDFILSRVFTEDLENLENPPKKRKTKEQELVKIQKSFFEEGKIIVLSEEKWQDFKNKISA